MLWGKAMSRIIDDNTFESLRLKEENNVRVLGVDVTHLRLKEKETSPLLKGRLAAFSGRIKS